MPATLKASYEQLYAGQGLAGEARFYRWIVGLLNPARGQRLLDVACGEGMLVQEASAKALQAVGLDIAEAAVAKARLRCSGSFLVGDGQRLPFAAETFDCVTCLGSLENMPEPGGALAEICRVTKRGGVVCVMVPNAFWLGDVLGAWLRQADDRPFQVYERRASRCNWRRFLLAGGLQVERELRYNRPAALFRRGKMKSVRKFLACSALNWVTPFNLSLEFVYLCRKTGAGPATSGDYWIWKAQQSWNVEREKEGGVG